MFPLGQKVMHINGTFSYQDTVVAQSIYPFVIPVCHLQQIKKFVALPIERPYWLWKNIISLGQPEVSLLNYRKLVMCCQKFMCLGI